MFHLGGQFFPQEMRPFNAQYRVNSIMCYSGDMSNEKLHEMDNSGKLLLPQSALDWLTRLHITYPLLFKVTNPDVGRQRTTHCGVFEFHQEEGRCYMPHWMMQNLLLNENDLVQVEYTSLPTATYVKFKPQSTDFLDISNHRAVLEIKLRNYACLTKGDVIAVEYNNKSYEFLVQDLKPANAVSIIECDMNVEFDAPVGYSEPQRQATKPKGETTPPPEPLPEEVGFRPFSGEGVRLDGKKKSGAAIGKDAKDSQKAASGGRAAGAEPVRRGIPNYDYKPGTLTFNRTAKPKQATPEDGEKFVPFGGQGAKLRERTK